MRQQRSELNKSACRCSRRDRDRAPDTHHLARRLPVVAWLRQICSRQAPDLQALQVAAGCEADNGILNISGGNDDVFLSYG